MIIHGCENLNFEIKYKDARGRSGILKTPHGKVRTPALMPVIHPGKQTLDVKKHGAEIVITNAYIIYKNQDLKIETLEYGVHRLINFPGPVVTDSGSFQLSEYGDIQINNQEIVKFQEEIGADIGTSLDIPTPPFVSRKRAQKELQVTIRRAREALRVRDKMMLNSVVQGSTYPDLRAECARALGKMEFDVYPIGAVVPLMENYHFTDLMEVIMASVPNLPESHPRHLMGAGHPMIFAFAVALGCDLFDSAAYILYAQDDRILMPNGTFKLKNLSEMPCPCSVCSSYTPDELRNMKKDDRIKLIAEHNLNISFAEIRLIRQALVEGSLWELVEQRCRSHPYLLDALRNLKSYKADLERYDPPYKKSAFLYSGSESLNRPEVHRHLERLKRLPQKNRLLILPPSPKPYSKHAMVINKLYTNNKYLNVSDFLSELKDLSNSDLQVVVVDIPFGVIPLEIEEVYPLSQNESPQNYDEDAKLFLQKTLEQYIKSFKEVIISDLIGEMHYLPLKSDYEEYEIYESLNIMISDKNKISYMADYQLGAGSGEALLKGDIKIVKSKRTGKIRHIYGEDHLIATIRASDGVLVWGREGARRLHGYLPYPLHRVVVDEEAEPFALEGKSIFAKFVIDCDRNIKASEEVLMVNSEDELLAYGKSVLNGKEMMDLQSGQAVKTRRGGF